MKKKMFWSLVIIAMVSLSIGQSMAASPQPQKSSKGAFVTLEVLNPRGEVEPPPTLGLNPRLTDLNGKTIALMDNWKSGGVYLQDRFEKLLKQKYPNVKILRTTKPEGKPGGGRLVWSAEPWYPEVANQCDAFIYTISD